VIGDVHRVDAHLRFHAAEGVAGAVTFVFVVHPAALARTQAFRFTDVVVELDRLFIQANHRPKRVAFISRRRSCPSTVRQAQGLWQARIPAV